MADFADRVRSGAWTGHTGKRIRNVVNIGIGGSDLGPVMAYEALRHYSERDHDLPLRLERRRHRLRRGRPRPRPGGDAVHRLVEDLHHARDDDQRAGPPAPGRSRRSADEAAVASTSSRSRPTRRRSRSSASTPANMFGFWDWVGGRYSMDSAIGLSTMIAVGPERFREMLPASTRWTSTSAPRPFERNLPVLMGLLAVWYSDFFGAQTVAVLPYDQYLKRFPAYLQQLTMESNGKQSRSDGRVDYDTGPIYWGEPGTNGQHSFYQLIHQGTRLVPVRLHRLRPSRSIRSAAHHDMLMANVFAQARRSRSARRPRRSPRRHAGLAGPAPRVRRQPAVEPRCCWRSSRRRRSASWWPSTSTASSRRGRSGIIDSFDQWGVELGKVLAQRIIRRARARRRRPRPRHDSSTNALIRSAGRKTRVSSVATARPPMIA